MLHGHSVEYYEVILNVYEESLTVLPNYIGKYHSKLRWNNKGNILWWEWLSLVIWNVAFFYLSVHSEHFYIEQFIFNFLKITFYNFYKAIT